MFLAASAAAVCLATPANAEPPKFQEGGFVLTLQYGPGFWALAQPRLAEQVDPALAGTFVADAKNTHTATVRMAYTILGHASVGAELTATGWNLAASTRGGAGFALGTVTWHPLQLVFMQKQVRPLPIDFGTTFGVGYGIAGQTLGMDGLVFEWAANLDWFIARYFALGIFVRGLFLDWRTLYLNYNEGVSIALPKGSGGAFWTFGLSLNFRAGD
jgi:hypothetical protein